MNKSYKTVWNEVLRAWVAVSEAARSRGKRSRGALIAATGLLLGLASSAAQATYTLTGDLGLLQFSAPCTPAAVPSTCASETRSPLSPSSGAGALFFPGSYLLVGFNNSNSNNGPAATGSVTFTDTSAGRAEGVYLGYEANTRGTMTISGPGSTWRPIAPNRASPAVIGHYGAGTLDLLDGGRLDSVGGIIGNNPGAQGVVTLSRSPPPSNITDRSHWRNQGALTVGNAGANGALSVRDGAAVDGDSFNTGPSTSSPGVLRVGMGLNATGSVIIAGANPNGTSSSALFAGTRDGSSTAIGDGGTGTLRVLDGGNIRFDSQGLTIGTGATGRGSVTVSGVSTSGTSSSLSITNSSNVTFVGSAGGQGSLDVLAGGSVILPGVTVGASGGSGTVRVAGINANGAASRLAVKALAIGAGSASSGALTLSEGGILGSAGSISLASGAGSKGTLDIGAAAGEAPAAPGTLSVSAAGPQLVFNDGQGTLNFNHTGTSHEFGIRMASLGIPGSSGAVINQLAGVTNLTGDSSAFLGTTHVTGGTLRVNGTLGGATAQGSSQVHVSNGATLGGAGTIGGSVAVGDGVLAPGNSPGTFTIMGNLALSSSTQLNYELGQANVAGGPLNDLTVVQGHLTLDGTLNVTQSAGGQFGAGIYRLIDYAGTLTDNGLALGSMPAGTENFIQTSVAQQVNLVNSKGLTLSWWDGDMGGRNDGVIAGGNGTWTAGATSDRWTQADGLLNAPYQDSSFAIFAGAPGTVSVDNSQGPVRVSGMQFATSGYRVEGGSVELTAGTNAIRVGDGTAAGAGATATIASALTGAGRLDKVDAGTLVLTGANSYSGGTVVSGGTLIGSAASFGSGAITDNAALVIEQAGSAGMANPIDGTGGLTVRAGGTLNYTGIGTLSGPTTVAAGTLAVNGSLANSAVAVAGGATLAGSGTVGATTVHSGATVAPGNGGIGTLKVNGAYTQAAGSIYQVQVQPGTQDADRIAVAGHANIGSGAALNVARSSTGRFAPDIRYTVLSADGGVSGRYALTGDTRTAFVQLTDSYDANHVYLTAEQFRAFGSVGATRNQFATGKALDLLPGGSALATALAWLPTEAAARAALDQLAGEIHASIKAATIEDSRFVREAALERLRGAACAPGASSSMKTDRASEADSGGCAADGSERVLWAQTFGSWGRTRGDGNAESLERDIGGFFVGADTGIGNSGWRVGGLGGYSRGSADTDTRGRGKTDSYHLGLYGGTQWGATALRLGAAYAHNKVDTQRSVAFDGFADRPSAKYDSRTAQLFGEIGHRIDLGSVALEPFAGLAYVQLRSGALRERGGAAALQGDGDSLSSTFATLGVRASAQLGEKTRLRGMLGWRRAFGDTAPESRHAFAGNFTPFAAAGVPLAKNVAVLEAGVDTELAPDLKVGAAYAGQFGSGLRDHGFKVNLSWKF